MKNLRMKDIREKLQLIGDEGGLDMATGWLRYHEIRAGLRLTERCHVAKATLEALDLEADFDEASHDRQMATLYGNGDYYAEAVSRMPRFDNRVQH